MITPIVVPVEQWRDQVRTFLDAGARFTALYGDDDGSVRCVMTAVDGVPVVLTSPCQGTIASIVDLVPAADWSEREAHDLYGIDFGGHEPMRALVNQVGDWLVPVTGEGVHEIAVGPIHAGIIESGHFRIHAVGELVLLVDLRLFYKHRGLERAAEGASIGDGLAFVQRACAGCAVANSVAFTIAAEQLIGVEPSPASVRVRTVLLELERLWNHLNDLSAMCAGVGFATGAMAFAALKEDAQRLNQRLFGHRFLFNTVAVGGGLVSISAQMAHDVRTTLANIATELDTAWRVVLFNASVQERLRGAGVLTHKMAARGGAVGPVARASGLNADVRTTSPKLAYQDFTPATIDQPVGDVAARARIRHAELVATLELLNALVDDSFRWEGYSRPNALSNGRDDGVVEGRQIGVGRVESARGETVCCVEATEGVISRLHLRTSSYANWPLVGEAAAGSLVGEFPIINKSFELCYACVDR